MKPLIYWLSIFLGFGNLVRAQSEPARIPYIDFNAGIQAGIPQGDFRENIEEVGIGGGGSLLVQLGRLPILAGVSFGSQVYQSASLEYAGWVEGQFLNLKLRTRTNISMGHVVFRYQPVVEFPLWPYVDGMAGYHKVFTRTKLLAELEANSYEELESETDQKELVYSFGAGAGVQLAVFRNPAIRIDLRGAYLLGGSASYLIRDEAVPAPVNDPIEVFEPRYSATNVLLLQVGITVDLGHVFQPFNLEAEE